MKSHKLLLHSLFSIAARFVGVGLNFLLRIVITRTLPLSEAGILFLLMTFIPGMALLSRMGLEQLIVKEVASAKQEDQAFRSGFLRNSYKIGLMVSLIVTVLWALASPLLQRYFFHNQIDSDLLILAGLSFFFFNLMIINTFYLKAVQQTIRSVLMQNALPASSFLVLIALMWQTLGQQQAFIAQYIISLIIAGILSVLITWPYFNRKTVAPPNLPSLQQMLKQSLPLAPISFFSFMMLWADTLMVGFFLDTAQVALFSTAATVSFVSLFFLGALDATIYPRLLNIAKQRPAKLKGFFWQATLLVIVIIFVVTALMALFSAPILRAFNDSYIAAQSSLMILLFAQFLRASSLTFSFMFIIREKVRYLNVILVLALLLNLLSNALFIPQYGMEGAALATLLANGFLAFAVIFIFTLKKL
jgi:O-antigen/teichoic acid export membrane protein